MAALLGFAFLSGVITILSPCILPVLPIVLAGGAGRGTHRPLGVVTGFVLSFTVFTLTLTAIVGALGIPGDLLRYIAVGVIVAAGVVMLVPRLRLSVEGLLTRLVRRAPAAAGPATGNRGFWGGLPIGLGLGLLWTPCVGPIMASVISLALTQRVDGGAVLLTIAYTLGTSLPMLAVMIGGRTLLNRVPALARNMAGIQRVFGALMILVGVGVALGLDRKVQTALLTAFPRYGAGLTAVESTDAVRTALRARDPAPVAGDGDVFTGAPDGNPRDTLLADYGQAPPIVTSGPWINGGPLTMEGLRGKVVLVDFWTYSCVNCVRTIPYLRAWDQAYRDEGLVIVGVHTPEFEFEKSGANVERAVKDLGVSWPVVLDNDWRQWRIYRNQYWPAKYLIDAQGRVRSYHYGEGDYAKLEMLIQTLLREAGATVGGFVSAPDLPYTAQTPETYLGYLRARGFASTPGFVADTWTGYTPTRPPADGEWSLEGTWSVSREYVVPQGTGVLELGFTARNVFLVIEPQADGGTVRVTVDGRPAPDTADTRGGVVRADTSRLYQLVGLRSAGSHLLRLEITGELRLFAFTFG